MENLPEVIKQCIYGAICALLIVFALVLGVFFLPELFRHFTLPAIFSAAVGVVFLSFIFDDDEPDPSEPLDNVDECDKVKRDSERGD